MGGELLTFAEIIPSVMVRSDVRRLDREPSRARSHPRYTNYAQYW